MAPSGPAHEFSKGSSEWQLEMSSGIAEKDWSLGPSMTNLFLGLAVAEDGQDTTTVAIAIHDTTYLVDFSVKQVTAKGRSILEKGDDVTDHIIAEINRYEHENNAKFIGAGVPPILHYLSPQLCSRLWLLLDIVPIVMRPDMDGIERHFWGQKSVDEQADSMARKCIKNFGPSLTPLLQVGFRGIVQTDAGFRIQLTTLMDHQRTCGKATWNCVVKYARELRGNNVKIAFFSSTPQGGGVALMRHALVRLARLMNVDLTWYVPKPRPGVFRITKNMHNILQGVSASDLYISEAEKAAISNWIIDNAQRYWLSEGGPLRSPEEGGADVIVIDDPQMPSLIPLIKKSTPDRPVLYRSHIQIRSDLIAKTGSPQADVWDFLWRDIKHAAMFISHPIPKFVPHNVPRDKVAYMPATTDWLDGLNKKLGRWDSRYYAHMYNMQCHTQQMVQLAYPSRDYIVQVARFDPAKGIPTVIDAYAEFRRICKESNISDPPQLCICGNSSIDDPDASLVFDQTMQQLRTQYPDLLPDCSIMRLEAHDQLLNAMIANAYVVLQLSTREGFEVKVSEALHAGRPVIATRTGGIPLQVKDGITGYLVEPGDWQDVAQKLVKLFLDKDLYNRMSISAGEGVSDEVGTVGNALAWFYLASRYASLGVEPGLKGNEQWVNDMARGQAAVPYKEDENRLPREFTLTNGTSTLTN